MQIQKRSMNWFIKPSAYADLNARREKLRVNSQAALAETANHSAALIGGSSSASAESVSLTMRMAVERIQKGTTRKV